MKGEIAWKKLFCCFFAFASLLLARADDFAFVYRGRVDRAGKTGDVDVAVKVSAYSESTGGTAVWTRENTIARINSQGVFQLELVDDVLAAAFREGKAKWLGVAFGGGAEQYPRQRIFRGSDRRARRTGPSRLAPNAQVGALDAETVMANAASLAAGVEIDGTLAHSGGDTLSVSVHRHNQSRIRFAKGVRHDGRAFKQAAPQSLSRTGLTAGETLFSGTRGGVVTIITDSNWTRAVRDVLFAPAGDIRAPFSGQRVRARLLLSLRNGELRRGTAR